jgi:hypothetical protein
MAASPDFGERALRLQKQQIAAPAAWHFSAQLRANVLAMFRLFLVCLAQQDVDNIRVSCVRDAGVAGSNPATPTRLLMLSNPYRDSYRDRNGSATATIGVFERDDGLFQIGFGDDAPGLFESRPFALRVAEGLPPAPAERGNFRRIEIRGGVHDAST